MIKSCTRTRSRSNQSALTFNSADGTDPVTGEDAIEVPIDAVSSVQVRGAAYAPEFGLSAGTVTTVETQKAGDAWHVTLNDLEPRLRWRGGQFKGIESFTPRVTIAGPLVKNSLNTFHPSRSRPPSRTTTSSSAVRTRSWCRTEAFSTRESA